MLNQKLLLLQIIESRANGEKMRVVLDTNILFQSFRLNSPNFIEFFEGLDKTANSLFVSQVVVEEVVNNYSERLFELMNSINGETRKLNSMLDREGIIAFEQLDFSKEIAIYKDFLQEKILAAGTILPYPKVEHEKIVKRFLDRKKPFKQNGKGYRDTLIWENLLEMVKDGSGIDIAFISQNTQDFFEGETLHPDLEADLEVESGKDVSKMIVFSNLNKFVELKIQPTLTQLVSIKEQIVEGKFTSINLDKLFEEHLTKIIISQDLSQLNSRLPKVFESVSFVHLDEGYKIGRDDLVVREIGVDQISVTFQAFGGGRFDALIPNTSLGVFENLQSIEVIDRNWNKTYAFTQLSLICEIDVKAIFDLNRKQFVAAEIYSIEFPNIYDELGMWRLGELTAVPKEILEGLRLDTLLPDFSKRISDILGTQSIASEMVQNLKVPIDKLMPDFSKQISDILVTQKITSELIQGLKVPNIEILNAEFAQKINETMRNSLESIDIGSVLAEAIRNVSPVSLTTPNVVPKKGDKKAGNKEVKDK